MNRPGAGCFVVAAFLAVPFARPAVGQQLRPWHTVVGLLDSALENSHIDDHLRVSALMAVGNHAGALEVATAASTSLPPDGSLVLAARASAALDADRYREAAVWYSAGAELAEGLDRAALLIRAGRLYERIGLRDAALDSYRQAVASDTLAGPWVSFVSAGLYPDSVFFDLLSRAPPGASRWADLARAQRYREGGLNEMASRSYLAAGFPDSALGVLSGDSNGLRSLVFELLASRNSNQRQAAYDRVEDRFQPRTEDEMIDLASQAMTAEDNARAADLLETVVASDSSALPLRLFGRALERSGRRPEALLAYGAAATGTGPEAVFARYARGMLLLRMRRYGEAIDVLKSYAADHPDHRLVPAALGAVAKRLIAQGRLVSADTVVFVLDRDWARFSDATDARMDLADRAAAGGDVARARRWYRAEIGARGTARSRARFELANLERGAGETDRADSIMASLARTDSLGYYGMKAREAMNTAAPNFGDPVRGTPSERVSAALHELDLLNRSGLQDLAESHLSYWVANDSLSADEMLSLAEGLVDRHIIPQAVRLGWRAAGRIGLNHIRVIRAIFPWPYRGLIELEAEEWGVDPFLVAAIIRQESAFDAGATSRAGARGLMQLMPPTARWRANQIGRNWSDSYLGVPDANLHIGVGHLADLSRRSDDIVFTLAAYNAGGGNLRRWRRRPGMNDPETFVEKIPFPETRGYVKAVLRNRDIYRALYSDR